MRCTAVSAALLGSLLGLASTATAGDVELATVRVASGMNRPILATHAPGDFQRLFIVEKRGLIRILNLDTGVLNGTSFLNIDALVGGGTSTNDERGLLGLAFHPDYQKNGRFFVNYTNNAGNTTIAEYTVSEDPDIADTSWSLIKTIGQPQVNHNGGWMGFSPIDGYLYVATGDGGGANDTGTGHTSGIGNGQDITNNLLGKMLRYDVDGDNLIPADNPFVGITGDDDIWAYGLRNPWRPSFDRETGDLWIADVGQNLWEEVNIQYADSAGGENYGWRCREGAHNFNFGASCSGQTFVEPIHEYVHGVGFSITGGYVYRGTDMPCLQGQYFFADYVINHIWTMGYDGNNVVGLQVRTSQLTPSKDGFTLNQVASFGEDAAGEIYIVDQGSSTGGQVFKVVPADSGGLPGDVNGDGSVNVSDLVEVITNWGPCADPCDCFGDTNGDGMVDVTDLVTVITGWSS